MTIIECEFCGKQIEEGRDWLDTWSAIGKPKAGYGQTHDICDNCVRDLWEQHKNWKLAKLELEKK